MVFPLAIADVSAIVESAAIFAVRSDESDILYNVLMAALDNKNIFGMLSAFDHSVASMNQAYPGSGKLMPSILFIIKNGQVK